MVENEIKTRYLFWIGTDLIIHVYLIKGFSIRLKIEDKLRHSSTVWGDVNKALKRISKSSTVITKEYLQFLRFSIILVVMATSFLASYAYGHYGKVSYSIL